MPSAQIFSEEPGNVNAQLKKLTCAITFPEFGRLYIRKISQLPVFIPKSSNEEDPDQTLWWDSLIRAFVVRKKHSDSFL